MTKITLAYSLGTTQRKKTSKDTCFHALMLNRRNDLKRCKEPWTKSFMKTQNLDLKVGTKYK